MSDNATWAREILKRLPIVRHVRYFVLKRRLYRHMQAWSFLGCMWFSDSDIRYLQSVWKGQA